MGGYYFPAGCEDSSGHNICDIHVSAAATAISRVLVRLCFAGPMGADIAHGGTRRKGAQQDSVGKWKRNELPNIHNKNWAERHMSMSN